ncbi:hypothetical protein ABZV24_22345 [Streptomyces sp. NPDC005251]|uniref:hypothetical protein n=1 Tax=Streptomyces sp. NPDC005251 TaxID=3157166 RepID=UPI0033ACF3AB
MNHVTTSLSVKAIDSEPSTEVRPHGGQAPAGRSSYLSAGAAFIARGFEAEALKTDNPADVLDACRPHLAEVLPQAAENCNIGPDLAAELAPYLEHWLHCAAELHRMRATASGPLVEVLDILLDAIRKGADPVHVGARVLELLAEARA